MKVGLKWRYLYTDKLNDHSAFMAEVNAPKNNKLAVNALELEHQYI